MTVYVKAAMNISIINSKISSRWYKQLSLSIRYYRKNKTTHIPYH